MPAASTCRFCGSARPRQGFARCARRWRRLDSVSALLTEGIYRSGGGSRRRENSHVRQVARTEHQRDDRPAHARLLRVRHDSADQSRFAGDGHASWRGLLRMAGFAADPITFDDSRGRMPARLVLVDAMELAWQRARYRGNQHQLLSADAGLVGLNTLQHRLWQRLQASTPQVAA